MPGDTAASKKSDHGTARNRKGRKGPSQAPRTSQKARATEPEQPKPQPLTPNGILPAEEGEEGDVCHICAETMDKKAYAVAECNHRTCYTCALRLRALYKRLDCTFCKACYKLFLFRWGVNSLPQKPQPLVIVTSSRDQLFESYAPSDTPFHDTKLSMDFETSDMMEDCLLLLRFNCPDVNCDHVAVGWPELKHHTKTVHDLFLWLA
jgi:E3 ubiquitin-protein ligase ZNF598